MERLEHLYQALQVIKFEDVANLSRANASKFIIRVEALEDQIRQLMNTSHTPPSKGSKNGQ